MSAVKTPAQAPPASLDDDDALEHSAYDSTLDFLFKELSLALIVLAWAMVVCPDRARALGSLPALLLSTYLPLRVGGGAALHATRAVFSRASGRGEELLVLAAALAAYVAVAHVAPGVRVAAAVKAALGKPAAELAGGAAKLLAGEVARVLYFSAAVLAGICALQVLSSRCGCKRA
jgi:hypothetical protein